MAGLFTASDTVRDIRYYVPDFIATVLAPILCWFPRGAGLFEALPPTLSTLLRCIVYLSSSAPAAFDPFIIQYVESPFNSLAFLPADARFVFLSVPLVRACSLLSALRWTNGFSMNNF